MRDSSIVLRSVREQLARSARQRGRAVRRRHGHRGLHHRGRRQPAADPQRVAAVLLRRRHGRGTDRAARASAACGGCSRLRVTRSRADLVARAGRCQRSLAGPAFRLGSQLSLGLPAVADASQDTRWPRNRLAASASGRPVIGPDEHRMPWLVPDREACERRGRVRTSARRNTALASSHPATGGPPRSRARRRRLRPRPRRARPSATPIGPSAQSCGDTTRAQSGTRARA